MMQKVADDMAWDWRQL